MKNNKLNDHVLSELTINHLNSLSYIIKTKAIADLETSILELVSVSETGGIVYGRPRIGKTHAIEYISNSIHEKYGEMLPVIKWPVTDHVATERAFYAELLMAMGCSKPTKGATALVLKERVINECVIRARDTIYNKLVIFIDEAWLLDIKDFQWLMDLYNRLSEKDITMTCILVGTKELLDLKNSLRKTGKEQIVQRFFLHEYNLTGMKDMSELLLCLADLDSQYIVGTDYADDTKLFNFYFPDAAKDGKGFCTLYEDYFKAFTEIRIKGNLKSKDIPMKYFIKSFTYLLHRFGRLSDKRVYIPGYEEIYECIEASQYRQSDGDENGRRK